MKPKDYVRVPAVKVPAGHRMKRNGLDCFCHPENGEQCGGNPVTWHWHSRGEGQGWYLADDEEHSVLGLVLQEGYMGRPEAPRYLIEAAPDFQAAARKLLDDIALVLKPGSTANFMTLVSLLGKHRAIARANVAKSEGK